MQQSRKRTRPLLPPWFWHSAHVAEVRRLIAEDIEREPRMCIPAFRHATRHLTKVLPDDDTLPNYDPHRTLKMDFATITTAKIQAYVQRLYTAVATGVTTYWVYVEE